MLTPNTVPRDPNRKYPDVAIATVSWLILLVNAIKAAVPATPLPKPPGKISSDSQSEILPCQRKIMVM